MKRIIFILILILCYIIALNAQVSISLTVKRNEKGIWCSKKFNSHYDESLHKYIDSTFYSQISYDVSGEDTLYLMPPIEDIKFFLPNGKQVYLNYYQVYSKQDIPDVSVKNNEKINNVSTVVSEDKQKNDIGFNKEKCSFNGIPLKGKVKIVTSFPDFKVQVVNSFPDLNVKVVENFPNDCGKWQFVESFPDFTVQFVSSFPDFKIKYVNDFPGLP